jgi:hypothetical protein
MTVRLAGVVDSLLLSEQAVSKAIDVANKQSIFFIVMMY